MRGGNRFCGQGKNRLVIGTGVSYNRLNLKLVLATNRFAHPLAPPRELTTPMDSTKARILEAAGNVFAQKGFEAGTVREICQLADVNLAAINYHFGDKRRLYLAAVSHAYSSREEELRGWPSGRRARGRRSGCVPGSGR